MCLSVFVSCMNDPDKAISIDVDQRKADYYLSLEYFASVIFKYAPTAENSILESIALFDNPRALFLSRGVIGFLVGGVVVLYSPL